MLNVDYTATAASPELLLPHERALQELSAKTCLWDPLTSPPTGGVASGADLVLCNCAWGPLSTDPRLLVSNLTAGAKPKGFVLLHTLLKGETLGDAVDFLSSSQGGLLSQVRGGGGLMFQ